MPQPVDELRSPQSLATALTVMLSLEAGLALLSAGVGFYGRGLMQDLITDPGSVAEDSLDRVDNMQMMIASGRNLLGLALLVVFLVWFHRVRSNGQVFRPDGFSQGAGWAIGAWFIPIVNFALPYRVALETWEASTQNAPDGSFRRTSAAPLTVWWVVYAFSWVLRLYDRFQNPAETAEEFSGQFTLGAVADLTTAVAAVLAVLFVRKLTALQAVKAVQGPNAAV
ncbi:DUF4328 domain-containing protein [Streptomyces sp. NPDC058401]|uniref:DUF4328 domain-containing protein n=1 Tax=Streptomyces sp. NPDC058401 TaxID=3346480 RepID=UPI003655BBA9